MKKKLLVAILATTMALSTVACGGSSETKEDTKTASVTDTTEDTASDETEEKSDVAEDDGIINFESESFKVEYTRHEVSTDWEGNPCLIYYYNFTNKSDEATSALVATYFQCFQNGVECETTFLEGENENYNNSSKDIQKDITLEVCDIFKLGDMSEVTIEASDWTSFSNDKDVQKITLE